MEVYTLNRSFEKENVIDGFSSIVWTERYYGDSDVELVVPATQDMITKLPEGKFLSIDKSDEVMILETIDIEDGKLKATGIGLLPWFNNRFIRTSPNHEDQYWKLTGQPGLILWVILYYMCHPESQYLQNDALMGISNTQQFAIPGLYLKGFYTEEGSADISVGIPYGPVYDAMRDLATTYRIGMQLTLDWIPGYDTSLGGPSGTNSAFGEGLYGLGFRSYKGANRTSSPSGGPSGGGIGSNTEQLLENSIVRFSPQMDSLTDIEELRSIAALKTHAYTFIPTSDADLKALITSPGYATRSVDTTGGLNGPTGGQLPVSGFDLRAMMIFANDITTDMVEGSSATLLSILNERAKDALSNNEFVKTVDGEIVPTNQFKYGIHYNMGDIVEVQGNSNIIQYSRVIEYIRSQDESGETSYPTVAMLD